MTHDVKTYVDRFIECPKTKPIRKQPVGELQPTEIVKEPWEIITADFITGLPESGGKTAIMNVIDKHSKLLYSASCANKISAEGTARLFLEACWQYEGLPQQIVVEVLHNLQHALRSNLIAYSRSKLPCLLHTTLSQTDKRNKSTRS